MKQGMDLTKGIVRSVAFLIIFLGTYICHKPIGKIWPNRIVFC
jgi:hypothetical protein